MKALWGAIATVLLTLSLSGVANTVTADEHFIHATDLKFNDIVKPGLVALLPNTALDSAIDSAIEIAKANCQSVTNMNITATNSSISFTISAGVYSAIANDINKPGLFSNYAGKVLYQAKKNA